MADVMVYFYYIDGSRVGHFSNARTVEEAYSIVTSKEKGYYAFKNSKGITSVNLDQVTNIKVQEVTNSKFKPDELIG